MPETNDRSRRLNILIAFGLVYLIWGSTYLSIRYAIQTIPPFLMVGMRFVTAGTILYAWTRLRGGAVPTWRQWRNASVCGVMLLLLGIGLVSVAEQRVPSGLAALIVATVPLWLVVIDWLSGGTRPGPRAWLGIALGLFGVGLLVRPTGGGVSAGSAILITIAAISWSCGTLIGRRLDLPKSLLVTTGMEMLTGGIACLIVGLALGEGARFHPAAVSGASLIGLTYLITLGSIVGYSAYTYLVTATTPAKLATYAYVNPVIAVLVGWLIAGESITGGTLVAVAVIVSAGDDSHDQAAPEVRSGAGTCSSSTASATK